MAMIHSDVCGPFDVESIHHKRYFVSFIDDFSCHAHIYFIATKDEVFSKYKEFIAASPHRLHTHILHSDNSGEYTGSSRRTSPNLQHAASNRPGQELLVPSALCQQTQQI